VVAARAARYEPSTTLDEAALASYTGEYQHDEKRTHTITREGTRLFIDIARSYLKRVLNGFPHVLTCPRHVRKRLPRVLSGFSVRRTRFNERAMGS